MKFCLPEWHKSLPSTNTVLLNRIKSGEDIPSGFVLAALEQTSGRGRFGKRWSSQSGRDLTFSFLLITSIEFPMLTSLSLTTALGVASALKSYGIQTQTKWPNDILVDRRKICGILSEKFPSQYQEKNTMVVGVGVNVNMNESEIVSFQRPVTSIAIQIGKYVPIKTVLNRILKELTVWINLWEKGGFPAIKESWVEHSKILNSRITISDFKNKITGTVRDFGNNGQIILEEESTGEIKEIWSGNLEPNL